MGHQKQVRSCAFSLRTKFAVPAVSCSRIVLLIIGLRFSAAVEVEVEVCDESGPFAQTSKTHII